MTFLELCNSVRQECGIQGQNPVTVIGQAGIIKRVVEWTRDADLFIQTLHTDWNFLWSEFTEDTVNGSAYVTKPNDFGMWDRESFAVSRGTADGRPLQLIDYQTWRQDNSEKTASEPYQICILPNSNLVLSVPADGTYEIYANYWKAPTLLTTNEQQPVYPERFQRAIVAKAKMFFFEDIESVDQWKQAETEFQLWIDQLESFASPNQQPLSQMSPEQIVVRPQ